MIPESFIPEPTQPMPTFTQTAFSQPAVNYQHDQPNQSIFSQPAVHFQQTQPTQTNQTNQTERKNMRYGHEMSNWIQKADHRIFGGCSAREHSNKLEFGGNEESKKMRKTMLKQQFTEFSVTKEKGLHKGYDRYMMMAGLYTHNGVLGVSDAKLAEICFDGDFLLRHNQTCCKTLESQKDWYHKTQIALEEKIRVLSANLENTTNTLSYTEKLHDQAQKEKKDWEVKYEATLARFEKWKESSKNLNKLIDSSMSTRTKIGLGFKEYFGEDEVFDLSRPSTMYPEPVEEEVKPLYSRSTDVEDPNSLLQFLVQVFLVGESHLAAAQSNPAGWSKRSAPVSIGRPVSAGCLNPAARPYFRPSSVYFNNMYWPELYDPMYMNEGRWGTAGDPSTDNDIGGRRGKGGIVKFGGGDGRISGKGTIRTSKLDFENVYYVEELQHFNLFSVSQICDKKNKVLFTDTDCLVLTEEYQLPDESQVVLRIPRERDLYTFSISELQPEQNVTCLVAKASLDESTRWHRRMAHVNFKTINKLAKEGLVDGLPFLPEFIALIENQLNKKVKGIRCDNGTEFKNAKLIELCGEKGIKRDYSNPRTPQQNGVAERKNRTLIEAARTMLADSKLPTMFWTEAVSTACYVLNRVSITNPHNKTPYELISGKVPQIGHLKPFGCQVTILNTSDYLGKFEGKADEGYLVGYAPNSKAYRVYNLPNKKVYYLAGSDPARKSSTCCNMNGTGDKMDFEEQEDARGKSCKDKARMLRVSPPLAFLYGEIEEEVYSLSLKALKILTSQSMYIEWLKLCMDFIKHLEPGMQDCLLFCYNTITYRRGTIDKTLFIKKDSRDIILVQVYVDDIIFGSTNKAWCDEFEVLMKGEFEMSAMGEMTFFLGLQVKQLPDGLFISQDKYVKDMLTKFDMESVRTATTPYEAAKTKLKDETDPPVNVHLYRSMIGSLMYLTASRPDIMFAVSACSRHQVTPLTSHLNAVKKIFKYLKGQPKLGLWYPKDSPFQLEAYSDSDYAGSHGDRKSTTGGCQFLGRRLISWQCKKQTIVATSSTEAEYVAAASCCAQVLWIQNQLLDYGFNFMNTKIFIDNQSTICIVKNPVFHQRTKHIEIRHHFIRDANEKNLIQVLKIHTDDNVADLLTKAFDGPRFAYLVVHIGMVDMVLDSAGSTMFLLVVIISAGCFISAGSYGLCCWFRVHADGHTSAGGFISADGVCVPAVCMVSAFDIAGWLVSATSHLVSAGSIQSCWWNNVSAA
ncbi:putative ribonuclease H-like domain-containing protein [Tanacetum coccineum]